MHAKTLAPQSSYGMVISIEDKRQNWINVCLCACCVCVCRVCVGCVFTHIQFYKYGQFNECISLANYNDQTKIITLSSSIQVAVFVSCIQ